MKKDREERGEAAGAGALSEDERAELARLRRENAELAMEREASLCYLIGGRVEPVPGSRSDRLGEFGERSGDPRGRRGVDGEFVVASADVRLCCVERWARSRQA